MKIHYAIPMGIIPIEYNHVNQTPFRGKNSQEPNPTKFL
jgi:hypothetical protein